MSSYTHMCQWLTQMKKKYRDMIPITQELQIISLILVYVCDL